MICRRIVLVTAAIAAAFGVLLAVPATRTPMLQWVGKSLAVDESTIDSADIVVVAIDAGEAGVLDAADLVRSGVSARAAVFVPPDGRVEAELRRRAAPYPDRESLYRAQLQALGVRTIVPSPRATGSKDESAVLPDWCDQHGYGSVLLVTSWHHARRLQREVRRSMDGRSAKVTIRIARYSNVGPENWWQSREGERTVIVELQKLALDLALHPLG
jgi:hypothetical protein